MKDKQIVGKNVFQTYKDVFLREMDFLFFIRRKFLIFCIFFPLASFGVLLGVFNSPVLSNLPIVVIDNDNTHFSKEIVSDIGLSEYVDTAFYVTSSKEAEHLVVSGKAVGVLTIPSGFGKDLVRNNGGKVYLQYNNQQFVQGGFVKKGVAASVGHFADKYNIKYAQRQGQPYYVAKVRMSPLVFNSEVLFNPWLNYQYFFLLGLLPAFIQLFIIGMAVYGFYFEFKYGGFDDLKLAVKKYPVTVYFAKSAPYFLLSLFMVSVMLVTLFYIIGTPFRGGFGFIMLTSILFIAASIFTGTGLALILRQSAFSATAIYAAPAFAYAGITFPTMAMPTLAEKWSMFLPLHHYHKILINNAMRGADTLVSGSFQDLRYLFIFMILCFVISIAALIFSARRRQL